MEFRNFLISAVLIGLVVIAILQGFSKLAISSGADNVLLDDDIINNTQYNINSSLANLENTTNSTKVAFEKEGKGISITAGFFLLSSILSAGTTFTSVMVSMFGGVFSMIQSTLGIPPVVIGVFIGIVIISVILLLWSLYKSGR